MNRSARTAPLVTLAISVSLLLTAVTVWSVEGQGRALAQREWADLRGAARTAVVARQARLEADARAALDAAYRAWQFGGRDELDAWSAEQRLWYLVLARAGTQSWALPQTPLERVWPTTAPAIAPPDAADPLERWLGLAESSDPLTRAGALLGRATYEQQLGRPLAAARVLSDAVKLLRNTPSLSHHALRAELDRIDALVASEDHRRATAAFTELLDAALADHPARLGAAEVARLTTQLRYLSDVPESARAKLAVLEQRATRRSRVIVAVTGWLAQQTPTTQETPPRLAAPDLQKEGVDPVVLAEAGRTEPGPLTLVVLASTLHDRYWPTTEPNAPWIVRWPTDVRTDDVLLSLGPAFGNAVLVPRPAVIEQFRRTARQRLVGVLATGIGMLAAWVLVIWVMLRALARQRELAHLQSRFVADVSHELKTPLALIRLHAETLAERRVRDPERVQSYLETITRESERLGALLDNILDMGRIESGRKQYEFGPTDAARVARQAWALFEPQFQAEGFEAHLEVADGLPTISADAHALQQVLVNLLQNAYRYSGARKYVRLAARQEGHVLFFIVEDQGIGMGRAELHRLGESFFRAEDTRVRKARGTGLGLAIVQHIVAAHRGKVEVQSEPNRGSTFTVWIPAA